jgi:hypothetical protein
MNMKKIHQCNKLLGSSTSTTPKTTFTTEGYTSSAEAYYTVAAKGNGPPDNLAYTLLDNSIPLETNHEETITVPVANGDYNVYVIIFKDGTISASLIINTAKGGTDIDWG